MASSGPLVAPLGDILAPLLELFLRPLRRSSGAFSGHFLGALSGLRFEVLSEPLQLFLGQGSPETVSGQCSSPLGTPLGTLLCFFLSLLGALFEPLLGPLSGRSCDVLGLPCGPLLGPPWDALGILLDRLVGNRLFSPHVLNIYPPMFEQFVGNS